ncbi:hypothetical protein N0754_18100 [Pseudomonas aeruginosa]|nr:hypothetical protein [Pseudomonas aeruginosa]MCS9764146.1 hypothetical protein [Pseudomonas aeruginosa]MCS9820323.1 hypothetical protein [Pseudomonas aeruginosa]MCT0240904.1 hypothetical protein [Pseudomonas aeruginosa]MCT0528357.1 hypothetical protein [Pseudomonas aeruginosa]
MSPNRRLNDFLKALEGKIGRANALRELVECCKVAGRYPGTLQFDNTVPGWSALFCGLLTFGLMAIVFYADGQYLAPIAKVLNLDLRDAQFAAVVSAVIVAGIGIGCLGVMASRNHQVYELADAISFKAALAHNGLTSDQSPREMTLDRLSQSFGDYARGNYSREIRAAYTGHFARDGIRLDFSYYQLHYVNRRVEVSTDSKGKTTTRTVYDHYDRYSLVIPFKWVREVSLRSDSQDVIDRDFEYRTNHPHFESQFHLSASSQLKAAKFAKPTVVLILDELGRSLNRVNLEFDANGLLCISFSDSDLLDYEKPAASLLQPAELAQAISEDMAMPKLRALLGRVQSLSNATDNNFAQPQSA